MMDAGIVKSGVLPIEFNNMCNCTKHVEVRRKRVIRDLKRKSDMLELEEGQNNIEHSTDQYDFELEGLDGDSAEVGVTLTEHNPSATLLTKYCSYLSPLFDTENKVIDRIKPGKAEFAF